MKTHLLRLSVVLVTLAASSEAYARQTWLDRLPAELLDVAPPSDRISGALGEMSLVRSTCASRPLEEVRRRIVDVAAQEWAYFGFSVSDRSLSRSRFRTVQFDPGSPPARQRGRRGFGRPSPEEFARLASSIGGYWTATPDGSWMLERQNEEDVGSRGVTRWSDPWSAAFVSWVMCEAGLGSRSQFDRSIAHRDYIDQAIRARDGNDSDSVFVAYDMGEARILPGDLVCSGSRPDYDSIADRRRQMGEGARTHCDVVVSIDEDTGRILTIGGNVGGTVSLKIMRGVREEGEHLHPGDDIFAHLKLGTDAIQTDALETSPTVRALGCAAGFSPPSQLATLELPTASGTC